MKVLKQLGILVGILFISHIIRYLTNIPIPVPVLGMIVLFFCLSTGILKIESIDTITQYFLDNLVIFFIPGGVGLITSLNLIKDQWMSIIAVLLLATLFTIITTGLTVQLLRRKGKEVDR